MNRTCDLRFRKPNNCVHLDLTSLANSLFILSFNQLVATSPGTYLSVCATSVQQSFGRGLSATTNLLCGNAAEFGFCWKLDSKPWHLVYFAGDETLPAVLKAENNAKRFLTYEEFKDLHNAR